MTISATDILVPVCSKIPLLYLLTQKVAQKFGYVLGIKDTIINTLILVVITDGNKIRLERNFNFSSLLQITENRPDTT